MVCIYTDQWKSSVSKHHMTVSSVYGIPYVYTIARVRGLIAYINVACVAICLSICLLSVFLSVCVSVCLSFYLSVCLSVCLSFYLSFICLFICLFSVCVSVFLSVRPSLSVCVSVFYLSTDPSQPPTYAGTILQRFPVTDRKTTPLPRGIEIVRFSFNVTCNIDLLTFLQ